MPVVSSLFLVIALALAVVVGPQTRVWTWGPAMMALGVSVIAALPVFLRRGRSRGDIGMLIMAALTTGWFAWRAWVSPMPEANLSDLILLCAALGAFSSVRSIAGNPAAERVLIWGVALLLAACVWVVGMQVRDPSFSPLFVTRAAEKMVSGFAAHYNEGANHLIGLSLLAAGAGLCGRHSKPGRALLLLLALAGLAGVYFTKSRGGILGATTGCGMLFALALVVAKRNHSKWFAPAVMAVPLVGIGIGAFLFLGWEQRSGGNMFRLLDNEARFYLMGMALSCIGLHPLAGGGSRSFTWESYQFVNPTIGGLAQNRPEFVHNELMQAATDYGLVGAALLAGLLVGLSLAAILGTLFEDRPREPDARDAWRTGALAALGGMFVQSCFSFVFHTIPGVILLGICLGMLSRGQTQPAGPRTLTAKTLLSLAAIGCAAFLLPYGWKGTQATRILWSTWFSKHPETSAEARIDALSEAIGVWPLSEFYQSRATVFQDLALANESGAGFSEPAESAIRNYDEAARLNPFEPSYPVNRANLLSQLERNEDAETAYALGIQLQGGMEPGFRGHFSLAKHLLRKGLRSLQAGDPDAALAALEHAAQEIETAAEQMHWIVGDMHEPRAIIHETLGTARETTGDTKGALAAYDFAATLRYGKRANYRAGLLIGKTAVDAWSSRQPSKALARFIEARRRIEQAGGELPAGVTPSQRLEYLAYLDRSIAFLKGAKVEPATGE